MPLCIIAANVAFMCMDKHEIYAIQPLLVLIIANQAVALINNALRILGVLIGDMMFWQGERQGYQTLYKRGE